MTLAWTLWGGRRLQTLAFARLGSGTGCGRKGCARRASMREPRAMPRHKVPAPQADGVAARLRPPAEAGGGRVVFGWGWGLIFQNVKSVISGIFRGLVGNRWKMGALGIPPPHPWSFCPLRGEGVRGGATNGSQGSGLRRCFMVINVIFRGKCSAWTPGGADTERNGREAALDMTTPHPHSLSPLRGEGLRVTRPGILGA